MPFTAKKGRFLVKDVMENTSIQRENYTSHQDYRINNNFKEYDKKFQQYNQLHLKSNKKIYEEKSCKGKYFEKTNFSLNKIKFFTKKKQFKTKTASLFNNNDSNLVSFKIKVNKNFFSTENLKMGFGEISKKADKSFLNNFDSTCYNSNTHSSIHNISLICSAELTETTGILSKKISNCEKFLESSNLNKIQLQVIELENFEITSFVQNKAKLFLQISKVASFTI